MERQTVFQIFEGVVRSNPDRVAYRSKKDGRWVDTTWAEHDRACRRVSKALIAGGVQRGEIVGILSSTRLEWVQADFGINFTGAMTLGIYPSSTPDDIAFLLEFSSARWLILEDAEQLRKVQRSRARLPQLQKIVIIDGASDPAQGVVAWNEFLGSGDGVPDAEFDRRTRETTPDDVAALVATSGTTGLPKLAMITHDNLAFTTWSVLESLPMKPEFTTLLFLPLAHVFARIVAYCCMRRAITLAFAENLQAVGENLKEVRPDFIASVPRIFEKVYEKIMAGVTTAGGVKEKLFHWAVGVGREAGAYRLKKQPVPALLGLKLRLADKLVLHKIRAALGGRVLYAVSGAAPLNPMLGEFFHACGILVLEGLGMTENTSFSNVNRIDDYRFGTVGPAGPGIEMKRAADGEICFRGRNVMKGYYNNPEATAEALDPDGWLLTGDLGEIDPDGHLRITDRKKDLIITAGGKNVAPQRVERVLRESPYISQAVCFGDKQKFITALITLEPVNIAAWAEKQGLGEADPVALARHPEVRQLIEREVAGHNQQLASFEQVKKFDILPRDLSIEAGELTPSLKVKRKVVKEKYGNLIERLYAEAAATDTARETA